MKRTAEEACIEYAIAVEAVREQTRILARNRCPNQSEEERDYSGRVTNPAVSSCLDEFWSEAKDGAIDKDGDGFDQMCEACQVRHRAVEERRELKKRLGAAKRSVEAVGKRLRKERIA